MSGPPVPQYGNFGGNGDNDAWEQADRYATFTANNYNISSLVGGAPGSGNLPDPRDYPISMIVHVARTESNVAFVKTVLADIDRQPKNDVDTAYLNHDLGYVPGNVIGNVVNNVNMGISVWSALLLNGYSIDAAGQIYGANSVPFIVGVGSAFNILTETRAQTPASDGFEVEAVVVTASMERSNRLIDLTVRLMKNIGGYVDSVVTVTKDGWVDFTSALGSGYNAITSALGNAWSWFKDNIFSPSVGPNLTAGDGFDHELMVVDASNGNGGHNHSLWGDTSGVQLQYFKISAGDKINISQLSEFDDNGDGVLTIADSIVASLGIATTPDGILRAFVAGDAIDVATGLSATNELVVVGALTDFYNAVNVGPSAAVYSAGAVNLHSAATEVKLVAPVASVVAEPIAA